MANPKYLTTNWPFHLFEFDPHFSILDQNQSFDMKKLLLAGFMILGSLSLFSQKGIHLGIGGGVTNTWILNKTDSDVSRDTFSYKLTLGYAPMVRLGYNFADPIGIHIGALYSKQGQKSTSVDSVAGDLKVVTTNRDLRYLKIPIMLHINSAPNKVMFRMDLGPQIGILMDAKYLMDNVPINPNSSTSTAFDPTQLFEPQNLSVLWALGVQFNMSKIASFYIEHRGDYGFADIENKAIKFNGSPFFPGNRDVSQNLTLGLYAGFEFTFLPKGSSRTTKYWFR